MEILPHGPFVAGGALWYTGSMRQGFFDKFVERLDRLDAPVVEAHIAELARERGFLETLFQSIDEGLLVVGEGLRLLYANHAAERMVGFAAEEWKNLVDRKLWYEAVTEANDLLDDTVETDIQGYDIDPDMVKAARENARDAGVDHLIHFQARPVSELRHPKKYGFLVTNPPYGERLEEKEALPALYREIGEAYGRLDSWSMYLITAYEDAERYIGRKADKNRKIYNGMLKTYFYQYLGPKPPRRQKQET